MSAGMNLEEAQKIANKMCFKDAVYNALYAKCVPYRKATKIKLNELLNIAKDVDEAKSKGCDEVELSLYYNGWNDGYKQAIDDFRDKICEKYTTEERKENYKQYCCNIKQELVDLAEQLKS